MPAPPAGRSVCDLSESTNRVHEAKIRGARRVSPGTIGTYSADHVLRETQRQDDNCGLFLLMNACLV